mgnify:CR=1 FL=1
MKRVVMSLVLVGLVGFAGVQTPASAGILRRHNHRGSHVPSVAQPTNQAESQNEAGRRYSYEPAASADRVQSSNRVPLGQRQLLPKTDPRRYINE